MSGVKLPAVRLPNVIAGQGVVEEGLRHDGVLVELPPSSKFAFAWPAESSSPNPLPLTAERLAGAAFSSSEGETDVSEDDFSVPVRRTPRSGDESEFVTPTGHMNSDQNPMDQPEQPSAHPRLSRAFSMPLPSQLGPLQNPRRPGPSPPNDPSPPDSQVDMQHGYFQDLSLELADSVQMVIQTLLQLSPPQLLDPAKEQFAACSLSIPTPSISALFTSMKNLNYMSANMSAFGMDPPLQSSFDGEHTKTHGFYAVPNDFDVGEMLQSVGDALSGSAAQAGIDLVLFHGDVGMKHVAVKGDESGISYALSHIIRQIIGCTRGGDAVEIGLFVETSHLDAEGDIDFTPVDGPLRCAVQITHRLLTSEVEQSIPDESSRLQPQLHTVFLRRLLRQLNASLEIPIPEPSALSYEFAVTLERGAPSVVDPAVNLQPEDAAYLGYRDVQLASEPTLDQLAVFTESLRGKKATLFARSKGSFAQHLTSYLTSWGLDVSHVSTESDVESSEGQSEPSTESGTTASGRDEARTPGSSESSPVSFIMIDDDVAVLRSRLQLLRAEQAYPLNLPSRKRPSLATNHRPRSSPQVARVRGLTSINPQTTPAVVIIHFTSLSNFKLVKDAVQSVFHHQGSGVPFRMPEVMVIPKPAGPRRVLTALHTAVIKPMVDPFFTPIATSPISPGYQIPTLNMGFLPKSPGARSATSARTASDKSARSPKESVGDLAGYAPSSPRGMRDGVEYFSDASFVDAAKLGSSPASGLVIQSPDGQPAGIYFHPKAKGPRGSPAAPPAERDRVANDDAALAPGAQDTVRRSPRPISAIVADTSGTGEYEIPQSRGKGRQASVSDELPVVPAGTGSGTSTTSGSPEEQPTMQPMRASTMKSYQNEPILSHSASPVHSPGTTYPPPRRGPRRPNPEPVASASVISQKKGKPTADGNIVPPISVLIVDDNPINQAILTTFMGKKMIKYDVAKNGEEAVQKWHSGGFHLILMDIQMPVMDGIQATKEIRRIEKLTGAGGFPSTPQSEGQRTPSEASTGGESRVSASSMTPPYRSSVIIVALTASSLQSDRVAALAAGCNDFLTKPVSLHWLNNKIIEWGSIKALQMWADIRPDVVKSISSGQARQAQNVARRLHVPEGRSTPTASRSRSSSMSRRPGPTESAMSAAIHLSRTDRTVVRLSSSDREQTLSSEETPTSATATGFATHDGVLSSQAVETPHSVLQDLPDAPERLASNEANVSSENTQEPPMDVPAPASDENPPPPPPGPPRQ